MSRTVETEVFTFDELSDKAKEKAREWFRDLKNQDSDWWDNVFEDAVRIGAILGIEIAQHTRRGRNDHTYKETAIYFGNMYCQGGGACFEGYYSYAKASNRKIRHDCPPQWKDRMTGELTVSKGNAKLAEIADGLMELQKKYRYSLVANVKQSGHYSHEYCTDIDVSVEYPNGNVINDITADDEKALKELLRDFMRWIYQGLLDEDEWRLSDEVIDEEIVANEHEFTEDGEQF